jgi:hypothetical protein
MQVFTLECERCGGIIAANVLARKRTTSCPTLGCPETYAFDDLPEPHQGHVLQNLERYGCEQ